MEYIHDYITGLQQTLDRLPYELIDELTEMLGKARQSHQQVFIMGNGGSASTASHFVADLAKNTRVEGWPSFRVIGLTDNMAILSAYANDEGYENVFANQLANLVRPGDIVIAISASGNSPNVLRGIELANRVSARTVGFTGFDGGKLGSMADLHIHVPSRCIEHVEDVHLMIEHLVCKTLRERAKQQAYARPAFPQVAIPAEGAIVEGGVFNRLSVEILNALTQEITNVEDTPALIQKVLAFTLEGVGASSGSFVFFDENGEVQQAVMAYAGRIDLRASPELSDVIERGLARWVIENRQAALVSSTRDDPRWLQRDWEQNDDSSRSAISVPVLDRGRVMGVLTLVHPQAGQFTHQHMFLLTSIALFLSLNREHTLK